MNYNLKIQKLKGIRKFKEKLSDVYKWFKTMKGMEGCILNEFQFLKTISNDLDLMIFSDVFRIIREETKEKDIDTCKITYDYTYLLNDFSSHQILISIMRLYGLSFSVKINDFGLGKVISFINFDTPMDAENAESYKVTLHIINVKYLKDNFFV